MPPCRRSGEYVEGADQVFSGATGGADAAVAARSGQSDHRFGDEARLHCHWLEAWLLPLLLPLPLPLLLLLQATASTACARPFAPLHPPAAVP